MTVMQKVMQNNLEFSGLLNDRVNVFQSSEVIKKIVNFTKITLLTIGSMSLSFYLVFLR